MEGGSGEADGGVRPREEFERSLRVTYANPDGALYAVVAFTCVDS